MVSFSVVHYRRYVRFKFVEYGEVRYLPMVDSDCNINECHEVFLGSKSGKHDNATAHTARVSMTAIQKMFDNRVVCHRSDSRLQECLKNSINNVLRNIKNGSTELGLKSLDPLDVPFLEMTQDNGNATIHIEFKNVCFEGLSNTNVTSVKDGNDISVFTKYRYFRFDKSIYRYRIFDSIYRIIYRFSPKFIVFSCGIIIITNNNKIHTTQPR
ncbi:hypothetical protein ANN_09914 [Periplaneta americana]|uniref:C2H2-type domain-containing protein n=1 Tax=Periplaneta americana TaxID=6978 RepID=A0ABQ8TQ97_PERAM|nr:hypothetical protein ANN_09914 [Periplaneta americana]